MFTTSPYIHSTWNKHAYTPLHICLCVWLILKCLYDTQLLHKQKVWGARWCVHFSQLCCILCRQTAQTTQLYLCCRLGVAKHKWFNCTWFIANELSQDFFLLSLSDLLPVVPSAGVELPIKNSIFADSFLFFSSSSSFFLSNNGGSCSLAQVHLTVSPAATPFQTKWVISAVSSLLICSGGLQSVAQQRCHLPAPSWAEISCQSSSFVPPLEHQIQTDDKNNQCFNTYRCEQNLRQWILLFRSSMFMHCQWSWQD